MLDGFQHWIQISFTPHGAQVPVSGYGVTYFRIVSWLLLSFTFLADINFHDMVPKFATTSMSGYHQCQQVKIVYIYIHTYLIETVAQWLLCLQVRQRPGFWPVWCWGLMQSHKIALFRSLRGRGGEENWPHKIIISRPEMCSGSNERLLLFNLYVF